MDSDGDMNAESASKGIPKTDIVAVIFLIAVLIAGGSILFSNYMAKNDAAADVVMAFTPIAEVDVVEEAVGVDVDEIVNDRPFGDDEVIPDEDLEAAVESGVGFEVPEEDLSGGNSEFGGDTNNGIGDAELPVEPLETNDFQPSFNYFYFYFINS